MPYEQIAAQIWKGQHRSMRSPFVDACAGYTEEFFEYRTDLEKSKALLWKAGISGTAIEASLMICPDFSPHIRPTAEAIAASLAKIGIKIHIEEVDEHKLRTAGFNHEFDMMLDPHIHMVADDYYVSLCDYDDAKWGVENLNQYFNEEVFALQKESLYAKTESERIEFSRKMQKSILQGAPRAFLLQLNTLMISGDHVHGLKWDPNGRIHYHELSKTSRFP